MSSVDPHPPALAPLLQPFSPLALQARRATGAVVGRPTELAGIEQELATAASGRLAALLQDHVSDRGAVNREGHGLPEPHILHRRARGIRDQRKQLHRIARSGTHTPLHGPANIGCWQLHNVGLAKGQGVRLLLRAVFTAAGGTHDNWDEYDRVMAEQRRTVVLVAPTRVYSNG